MQNTIPTIPHISTAPCMHFATACAMFHELAQKYATPYIKIAMENIVVPSMASYGFASQTAQIGINPTPLRSPINI